jgi:hypothetical protein
MGSRDGDGGGGVGGVTVWRIRRMRGDLLMSEEVFETGVGGW